jgi:hypothetical protein
VWQERTSCNNVDLRVEVEEETRRGDRATFIQQLEQIFENALAREEIHLEREMLQAANLLVSVIFQSRESDDKPICGIEDVVSPGVCETKLV